MTYIWRDSLIEYKKENSFKEYRNCVFTNESLRNTEISKIIKENINIDFSNSVFEDDIVFDNYKFYGDIIFDNTKFKKSVSFNNCIFNGDCIFVNVVFNEMSNNKEMFINSEVNGQHFVLKNIKNMPRLDGIKFSSCSKVILENLSFDEEHYEEAKLIYRIGRNQANIIGDYERIGDYYYSERYYGGKTIKRKKFKSTIDYLSNKFFDLLSKYTIGYGEKPFNIFIISFLIISIFAFLYMITGLQSLNNTSISISENNFLKNYIDAWYFSMVTFTTVGYGDMTVETYTGKILVSIEVFLGVTMAASWASVIIKKMSR